MANGKGCICAAFSKADCGCDADWTPQELIDARAEIARLRLTDAEREAIDRARRAFRDMDHNAMTMQQLEDYEALCGLLERLQPIQ